MRYIGLEGEKMLKIVVFDGGWGGELIADYLQNELNIIEIVRVIDWKNAPYDEKSEKEVCQLVEHALLPYIGKYDAIILGGYITSLAFSSLKQRFPHQKFIGMGINKYRIQRSRNCQKQVAVLASPNMKKTKWEKELRQIFPRSRIMWANCQGWEALINEGKMTKRYLYNSLSGQFRVTKEVAFEPAKQRALEELPLRVKMLITGERARYSEEEEKIATAIKGLEKMSKLAKAAEECFASEERFARRTRLIKPDVVLILNTTFLEYKAELEEIFGWETLVMEFREKVLREVCAALGLQGIDGKRPK